MAQKIADAVVCVFPDHVSGVLTPDAAFAPDNIRALYALSEAQYTALFGQAKPQKPTFEHYVRSGQKLLRCGCSPAMRRRRWRCAPQRASWWR